MRQDRHGDTRENEARQHRHRQNVISNLLMARSVGQSKDNMLHLVVNSRAGLKRFGLGMRRQVMEVGLEYPEGLANED